jgi:hypothetical protein
MQGLIAASALVSGCHHTVAGGVDRASDESNVRYEPVSDPEPEPIRIPADGVHAEAVWLNGRQLVLHVVATQGMELGEPSMVADRAPVSAIRGAVPHLRSAASPPVPSADAAAPAAPGPVEGIVEPTNENRSERWLLLRGLGGIKTVRVLIPVGNDGGSCEVTLSLPAELGGPVRTDVNVR